MDANLQQRLQNIEAKAALLVEKYRRVEEERNMARRQVADLTAKVESLSHEIDERNVEIERLRLVNVLSPDHRDVEAARAKLNGLVREIDKCINRLTF